MTRHFSCGLICERVSKIRRHRTVFWYAPTVLTHTHPEMEMMQKEIFGPVAPVMSLERRRRFT
ncbi:MAG: aldehyde dehydrogenase family protein [Betaproteobacteria bacterium]|nr:MAG: aldehyde dehydrogenase family protein [Betaproteobacteria bacterium]